MDRIGKGKFSTVFKTKNRKTGEICALKQIEKGGLDPREMKFIRDEIQIFTLVSHPNAAKMREVFENDKEIHIVMDLVKGGELFDFIVK